MSTDSSSTALASLVKTASASSLNSASAAASAADVLSTLKPDTLSLRGSGLSSLLLQALHEAGLELPAEPMSTINGPSSANLATQSLRLNAAASEILLKLSQPLEGDLLPGDSVRAQVVEVREQAQNFLLMLRVTLANGQQTTVQASSNRALDQGTNLSMVATSAKTLLASLQVGETTSDADINLSRVQTRLDLQQLPAGSTLRAQVQSSVAQEGGNSFRLIVSLLDGPQTGARLALDSSQPMAPGSQLTARVQDDKTLVMQPLTAQLDQLEVSRQLASQQARQGSLDGLLRALFMRSAGAAEDTQAPLRASIDKLLASLPSSSQMSDPDGVAQALQNSGNFLEPRLLQRPAGDTNVDLKAGLLKLLAQLAPTGSNPLTLSNVMSQAQMLPGALRSALGLLGRDEQLQMGSARFPVASRALAQAKSEGEAEEDDGLLKLVLGALARLQTHQLSSLAQTQQTADGNQVTTWQLEIPIRDRQDLIPLQMRLQKEEPSPQESERERRDPMQAIWRLDLAFDLAPLGPLQVQAQLMRGSLSSQFWAERAETAQLIDRELQHLRERLNSAGLEVGELASRQGMPPRGPTTDIRQRWVDETA